MPARRMLRSVDILANASGSRSGPRAVTSFSRGGTPRRARPRTASLSPRRSSSKTGSRTWRY